MAVSFIKMYCGSVLFPACFCCVYVCPKNNAYEIIKVDGEIPFLKSCHNVLEFNLFYSVAVISCVDKTQLTEIHGKMWLMGERTL